MAIRSYQCPCTLSEWRWLLKEPLILHEIEHLHHGDKVDLYVNPKTSTHKEPVNKANHVRGRASHLHKSRPSNHHQSVLFLLWRILPIGLQHRIGPKRTIVTNPSACAYCLVGTWKVRSRSRKSNVRRVRQYSRGHTFIMWFYEYQTCTWSF